MVYIGFSWELGIWCVLCCGWIDLGWIGLDWIGLVAVVLPIRLKCGVVSSLLSAVVQLFMMPFVVVDLVKIED